MAWIKIEDSLPDHPKIRKVGVNAAWLYISALCYSNRFLTDGFISRELLGHFSSISRPFLAAEKLVKAGLWITVEDGYQIHDYLEHQQSREEIEHKRSLNRDRQARFRQSSRVSSTVSNALLTPLEVEVEVDRYPLTPTTDVVGGRNARQGSRQRNANPRALETNPRAVDAAAARQQELARWSSRFSYLEEDTFVEFAKATFTEECDRQAVLSARKELTT